MTSVIAAPAVYYVCILMYWKIWRRPEIMIWKSAFNFILFIFGKIKKSYYMSINVDTQWCWYYRNREYLRRASKHFKEEVFFIHFIVTDGSIWINKWKNRECHFCKTDVHKSSTAKIIIQNELLYLELLIQCSEIQKQVYSRKSNIFEMERLP